MLSRGKEKGATTTGQLLARRADTSLAKREKGIWALLLLLLFLSACSSKEERHRVTAFLYTDNSKEEAFIRRYNEIFLRADLKLKISKDEQNYNQEMRTMFEADDLADIFSLWNSKSYQYIMESEKIADLRSLVHLENYNMSIFGKEDIYDPIKMLPIRYNYGNVMLVNMDILQRIDSSMSTNDIVSYEDLQNLAQLTAGLGYDFLAIGNSNSNSLGDLFFSAVLGWLDPFWQEEYSNNSLPFDLSEIRNTLMGFYSKFNGLFPNPSLANLSRSAAEKMFLDGDVLLLIGSSEELFAISQKSRMDVAWLSFPQVDYKNWILGGGGGALSGLFRGSFAHDDRQRNERLVWGSVHGAVLGNTLGIGVSSNVTDYQPMRYSEVSSVLQYYTGLYANGLRIRNWGIPVPTSDIIVADEKDRVMEKAIEFLDSINYAYSRPSLYLPDDFNSYLNQETWAFLQGERELVEFVNNLVDYGEDSNGSAP